MDQRALIGGRTRSLRIPNVRPAHRFTLATVACTPTSSSQDPVSAPSSAPSAIKGSWTAREEGSKKDYLHSLGASQEYNINVSHGQNVDHLDYLFTGNFLGQQSDIADGSLRSNEFRTFNNIVGDYYCSPRFLEKVSIHFVKNYLVAMGAIEQRIAIPLVLGIWGEKGMGKSFQTELAFKKLGVEAVIMSAGELEHEWAGTPGRLIRERYRKAAERSKIEGIFTCLMINDIDAGIGHNANTQMTVNNQIVTGTLMNICDDPVRVSIGQEWNEKDFIRRTPIVVTGNDLSKVFAPLVRDGRMEKFYWKPNTDELGKILHHMYKDDGIQYEDIKKLMGRFHRQPLDFFGALRASTYDNQIREWLVKDIVGTEFTDKDNNLGVMMKKLVTKQDLPKFEPLDLTLNMLIEEGERLEYEQEMVNQHKLSQEYYRMVNTGGRSLIGLSG